MAAAPYMPTVCPITFYHHCANVYWRNLTSYAVARAGRFGGLQALQKTLFLVAFAGFAGKRHQKKTILGKRSIRLSDRKGEPQ